MRYASLESDKQLSFGFPYNGGSTGKLTLRISPKYGRDVILEIEKGQFLCPSFDRCAVHVKFDKRPIESYSAGADRRRDLVTPGQLPSKRNAVEHMP
jgi:hypothetical protein